MKPMELAAMPKTYLFRIDDEETWRRFHSICALRGIKIKDAIEEMIKKFVIGWAREVGDEKTTGE
jgi:hypothetical protein